VVKRRGVFTAISAFALGWRQSNLATNVIDAYSKSLLRLINTPYSIGNALYTINHGMTFLRPLRLGIIGSGPAGFYAAARIIQKNKDAIVDLYEQLPTPFGLVRYGVAPDHPDVKVCVMFSFCALCASLKFAQNCQARFEEVAESPRFNFIGNIAVGTDITLHSMKHHYDALLFAYGASKDKTLGIPGEELKGIYSARAFVGWYNGLPEYSGLNPSLERSENAVIIGNGNVALDIARILLSNVEMLRKTDISEHAVEVLSKSAVRSVDVVGRRGPMQVGGQV